MTEAQSLTAKLGGKWYGSYGIAACPVCQPERRRDQSGLSLSDGDGGKLVAYCFKSTCDFRDIVSAAGLPADTYREPSAAELQVAQYRRKDAVMKRAELSRLLWTESVPITGTIAERYLRGRGINCEMPSTLRFEESCRHPSAFHYPAMIARIDGGEGPAVHRTYLRQDGIGKADIEPAKAMLGAVRGGAVRLSEGQGPLIVCEGIETGLSLLSGLIEGFPAVWAALSTSGMKSLHLPPIIGELVIAADGDAPGQAAAYDLADRAHRLGWAVSIMSAPAGQDFNDILMGKAVAA